LFVYSTNLPFNKESDKVLEAFTAELRRTANTDELVVLGLILPPQDQHRVRRQAVTPSTTVDTTTDGLQSLNLGKSYSDIYPAIFNIILWLMIALGLAVASVSYCIWFMDPGRDSVIYRMTANRMKKDL